MKKYISYLLGIMLLFSVGINSAFAALPGPADFYIQPLDCEFFGTCIVYVNDDPHMAPVVENGTKDYYYTSITSAVNRVKSDADYNVIAIADGTYTHDGASEIMPWEFDENDTWGASEGIYVYGGYSDDFDTRDIDTYETVIDANDAVPNVFAVENLRGNISGVEIKDVTGGGPAPIYVQNTGATTNSFVIAYSKFNSNEIAIGSAGVLVDVDGSNSAQVYGNEFNDNTGVLTSVISATGDVEVYNNSLLYNTIGSGIGCNDGATVYNNYVLSNDVKYGIHAWGGCDAHNNTIVGNDIAAGSDYAAVVMSNNGNIVANNLIAGNAGNQSFVHVSGDNSTFEYNALFDNGTDPSEASLTDGNVICDPLFGGISFTEPTDALLGTGSECIDIGKVISSVTYDYFETSRPLDGDGAGGAEYDPGAYEAPAVAAPSPGSAPVVSGLSVSPSTFSPDGDSQNDTTAISFNIDNNADVTVSVLNASDVEINKLMDNVSKSSGSVLSSWDGKNDLAQVVDDGTYTVKVEISNTDGSDTEEVDVVVDTVGGDLCAGYTDVSASHVDCAAIEYVQSIGAMTGNPNGTFAPYDFLQRDQIAKISLESFNLFSSSSDYCNDVDPFPDVDSNDWAYQYICRGVDLDMITGYEAGADAGFYRPARSVNRVEFLALILRNLSEDMPSVNSSSYDDVDSGVWYSGYAKYAYDNSLFTGNDLNPTNFTTRIEVAKVLYKLDQLGKM